MSIGAMGFMGGIAATPLAQTQGSEADRAAEETSSQSQQAANEAKSENAAGIGQTDGDEHGANERDADGHRLLEKPLRKKRATRPASSEQPAEPAVEEPQLSRDATGQSGSQLDLMI